MNINFEEMNLVNFKNHKKIVLRYSNRVEITGDNATGKTSLKDAAAWILYGTDATGAKLDARPVTYEAALTSATIAVEVDERKIILSREVAGGSNKFYVNEVPATATEFNEVVAGIAEKDVFLTLYNPEYFFILHWEKQRSLLLSFTTPPANSEVFKVMPGTQADELKALFKKHNIVQIEKIHRDKKPKLEKEYIAQQSRTQTLKEQSQQFGALIPSDSLHTELSRYKVELEKLHQDNEAANKENYEVNQLQGKIQMLTDRIESEKIRLSKAQNKAIESDCYTCGQPLKGDAVAFAEVQKEKSIQEVKDTANPLILQRKELRARLKNMTFHEIPEDQQKRINELNENIAATTRELDKHANVDRLEKEVETSWNLEAETRDELNNSIFILDALKEFKAKESELQAEKIKALFKTLSIKLFETVKTTGEIKSTFEIKMNDKEYKRLSLSEKIRAGLELRNVISEQSGIVAPVFVDNAESITTFEEPKEGQLITATVVKGQELTIIEGEIK